VTRDDTIGTHCGSNSNPAMESDSNETATHADVNDREPAALMSDADKLDTELTVSELVVVSAADVAAMHGEDKRQTAIDVFLRKVTSSAFTAAGVVFSMAVVSSSLS